LQGFETQRQTTQEQADRAGTALEMQGANTVNTLQGLDRLQGAMGERVQSALDTWNASVEKADEYVQSARTRAGQMVAKLDEINKQIGIDRDFAKAHDMQAAVQATLGAMKGEERNIAQMYGVGSKEYASFRASRINTMAQIQSQVQSNYAKLREEQQISYMGAVGEAMTQGNMFIGYNEQNHIQTMQLAAQNSSAYLMQQSEFELGIEQLRSSNMENLANWLVETPVFSLDTGPVVATIAEIMNTAATLQQPTQQQYTQASRNSRTRQA
jgi:hypothetical protein